MIALLILTYKTEHDILNISYKRKDGFDVGKFCKGDFQLNKVERTFLNTTGIFLFIYCVLKRHYLTDCFNNRFRTVFV